MGGLAMFIDFRHYRLVEQLNQRLKDNNLVLHKKVIAASQNCLAKNSVDTLKKSSKDFQAFWPS